jgi:hypothetical protein
MLLAAAVRGPLWKLGAHNAVMQKHGIFTPERIPIKWTHSRRCRGRACSDHLDGYGNLHTLLHRRASTIAVGGNKPRGRALPWIDAVAFAGRAIEASLAERAIADAYAPWVFFG